jgi:glutamine---fructose-6-phosphate transaminase (isomerizing)
VNQFLKEIQEQPEALIQAFGYYCTKEGKIALTDVSKLWQSGRYSRIVFTGMGSSFFVSHAAATMLSSYGIPAFALNAGELFHFQLPSLTERTLLICISQSGESYEVVQLVKTLNKSLTVIAISNEPESALVKLSEYKLLTKAGKEETTSTKTFISTYLVAYLLSKCIACKEIDDLDIKSLSNEVEHLINDRESYLTDSINLIENSQFVQIIGRGTDYAVSAQSALMFMEAARTPSSALLAGDFRHGPLEMVNSRFIGILFANCHSGTYAQMINLTKDILTFGGKIILISDYHSDICNPNLIEIIVSCEKAELFSIPAVIPIQLIINAKAESLGLIPGSFSHGNKVTSIE